MSDGTPFFSRSRLDGSFSTETVVGGKKTVRGVLWQRPLGNDFLHGNVELRYRFRKLFRTGYLAGSAFYDLGRSFDEAPPADLFERGEEDDRWQQGLGVGLRVALHDTFVVALDVGLPVDPELDGPGAKSSTLASTGHSRH
jgi:hemolysin activation/secretion protein